MQHNPQQVACEYHILDKGIHYFHWHQSDNRAIEEFFTHYEKMLLGSSDHEPIRMIIDVRELKRPPAIATTFRQMRATMSRVQAKTKHIRAAYLVYEDWGLLAIVKAFLE
ncbi:MAG TPA: hypothetical protein VHL11_14620, partial [Phototrophicaceae bacterium]|nr:hypothetical protein [Phototrophicaceae bacterium]